MSITLSEVVRRLRRSSADADQPTGPGHPGMDLVPLPVGAPRGFIRSGSVVLVALTMAGLLAACGGSTKTVTGPSTTVKATASRAAFTSCVEKQGIPASAAGSIGGGGRRGGRPGGPASAAGGGEGAGGGFTPPSLPAGVTAAKLRAALQACRSLLPAGGRFGGGGQFNSAATAAYRNCLQLHGVTLPSGPGQSSTTTTPAGSSSTTASATTATTSTATGSTPTGGGRGLGGLDTSNPTVAAAVQACAALRPSRAGSPTSTSTSTTS